MAQDNQVTQMPQPGTMVEGYDYTAPITFDGRYGWLASGSFPRECIAECSAGGRVDDAVSYWCKRLNFTEALAPHRELVERYLREYGAWEDLGTADMETLAHRVLWTACCDMAETGECWAGLVH